MTNEKKERIKELEKELAPILEGANSLDEKYRAIKGAFSGIFSGGLFSELSSEDEYILHEYGDRVVELGRLYDELAYNPDEDEKALAYLFHDGMSTEEKLKALASAWWYATNSGYCDAMANRLMAGEEDEQTQRWEQHCSNEQAIDRYYNYLKEEADNA